MKLRFAACLTGFIMDLILGDPHGFPHPIIAIGKLISFLEKILYPERQKNADKELQSKKEFRRGSVLCILVIIITVAVTAGILMICRSVSPIALYIAESIMTWQILAVKSLRVESMKVYKALKGDGSEEERLKSGRHAVSMIVGRDTESLSVEGVTKAAVETVAENASDGVIAPMIFLFIGGPVLGFFYKAVNTMDSMIGYKNDRYLFFGRAAAKLDDVLNYLPSRLSALLMIGCAYFADEEMSGSNAWKIWRRDSRNHSSPNSAQTESVMAGALQVRLAGNASYFGKIVEKPTIGDAVRDIEIEDIVRANRLMTSSAVVGEGIGLLAIAVLALIVR
ncbi:adenosylcobinamide-phosphate synthase [Lachnospiraceae bacterium]|nr:adenosylcobinamide-phosphate synthase [Lachnospiraceae bacterium]